MQIFRRIDVEERGAGMVEYALITALIALMSFSAVTLLGEETSGTFDEVSAALDNAGGPGGSGGSIAMGSVGGDGAGGSGATTSTTTPAATTTSAPATTTTTAPATTTTTAPATTTTTAPATTTTTAPATTTTTAAPTGGSGGGSAGDSHPTAQSTGAKSSFYWWNADKHGGEGAWTASTTYQNSTSRHQYLDLLVTRVDDKGKTTTIEVKGFYVPANGSTTYTLWDNSLDVHKDNVKGTVEVRIEVTSVTTSDEAWKSFSYQVDSSPVSVLAPDTP